MKKSRILWVCNKVPLVIGKIFGINSSSFGGWLDDMCNKLILSGYNICIIFPDKVERQGIQNNISFYSFLEHSCRNRIKEIIDSFFPDIIHIWGTEFSHSLVAAEICAEKYLLDYCVVSVQGLVSICGKYHYTEGLPYSVIHRYTFRDFIKRDNIAAERRRFIRRGRDEISCLNIVRHVIGRTDWDQALSLQINNKLTYHFCNESLRSVFYDYTWNIDKIERHSIFFSQCNIPLKGFHYLLESLPEIIKQYPDTHIYTTGKDLLNCSFKEKIIFSSYQKYLLDLIIKLGLEQHVTFLGNLSADEMCKQYLKANVFLEASSIENSPNSLGEAMLIGCPVVVSDVGGVKNMLRHEEDGFLYQSTAPYMIAYYVCKIFSDDSLALKFSGNAQKHAAITHDLHINFNQLISIYKELRLLS